LQASLGFLQDADDLFFGESLFHCRSSLERTLHRHRTKCGEQVTLTPISARAIAPRMKECATPLPWRRPSWNFG
ncbi:hypothetical protein, partial [Burkholderia sp. BE12]|uniref:hypothetical protein n=1 Tax=Burkholderia sp. BE12 TaxID=2082394 RepID=UPI001F417F6D